MFRFEESVVLYLLALIPVLVLFYYWMNRKLQSRIQKFGSSELILRLLKGKSGKSLHIRYTLEITGIALLILAASNPQWGTKKEKVKVEKSDIFIGLDISNSMNARDISPSRLDRAKKFAESLIQNHKGDRIGLILFAGAAYLQMPLTTDYAAAQMFVRSANSDMAGTQGTDIRGAIELAENVTRTSQHQKALVIISDGEDHDGEAVKAAQKASENGITIFTVGVGTEEGAMIMSNENGRSAYKTDEEGNPVRSRLNIDMLKDVAGAGGGSFFLIGEGSDALSELKVQLEKIQKREVDRKSFTEYNSYFPYFIFLGIVLLMVSFFINPVKKTV
ncbi:MAG: VWA domain-containing protein [Saprospiraceae bacterium]|nr:VWA domain-containing protein [Saprospiraceae bacterium]